ncbi:Kef-type potassium/proton antiporter (CPA2 family) [Plasticicumulans lactativorans]|uniref:Kef-type potassium/proton antiporter (CPA2 family) n=1 Tax=Plasticicumulans lactativorans TaxID=1133106 RepID=A0A4R2L0J6_9GAMM|nr:monovalent cation:proton antiporter-2 (CPA2) family protein [Plasticicumulans lactativorans]TCO79763.1 Kef-type potassium/proton antiporter (CPA2 family) [Plasticicumulans lactativorans]
MPNLMQTLVMLAAAVVAVPLGKRVGLGAVLGYVAAGMAVGPWGLGVVRDAEAILHLGEFGVVLLLFVIGLELQPSRLWTLRYPVFGLGGAQVLVTGTALSAGAWALGLAPAAAVTVGFALSLSSTAFVLQLLAERQELTTRAGRDAFAILLFQDLAVIPLLALVPLLATQGSAPNAGDWMHALKVLVAVVVVIGAGHVVLPRILRMVAAAHHQDVSIAAALVIVLGMATAMDLLGLSMSLGAFLAGVLLAGSEFRHELEANIAPFKGVLLGFFFMAVGMSANLGLLLAEPATVLGLTLALMAAKAVLLALLVRRFGSARRAPLRVGLLLAQGGEFAFVLFSIGATEGVLGAALHDRLVMVVALSMAFTPLAATLSDRWQRARAERPVPAQASPAALDDADGAPVVIAGYGRYGRVIARVLSLQKIPFTVLDNDISKIAIGKRLGRQVFYGDICRPDILHAIKLESARVLVVAMDDEETSLTVVELVRRNYPHVTIYARTRNIKHTLALLEAGAHIANSDTYMAGLLAAGRVMNLLGRGEDEVNTALDAIRVHDERLVQHLRPLKDDAERIDQIMRQAHDEMIAWLPAAPAATPAVAGPAAAAVAAAGG